jgi:ligand-binding sensor domain-containing protein
MKHIQLILLFFPIFLFGQTDTWKNYTTSTVINAIAHYDTDIWVATDGGVTQYNTVTGDAHFYNRANANLPYNHITSIVVDQIGTRWLGTFVGLVKWEGNDLTYMNPGQPIRIWKLGVDKIGTIWMRIAYSETPLASYHPVNGWKVYNINTLVGPNQNLSDIRVSPNLEGVYFSTYNSDKWHFYHYDGEYVATTNLPAVSATQSVDVTTWEIDDEGHFWFVNGKKLFHKTGADWEVENIPIWADEMVFDMEGKIWLFENYHPNFYRRDTSEQYTEINMNSVNFDSDVQLSISPTNELWVVNEGTLFKKVNQELIPVKTSAFDLPNNKVRKLMVTGQQKIWGAFDSDISLNSNGETSVSIFENQTWKFDPNHGYPNSPRDLAKDVNERVLVANWGNLSIFDGSWKKIDAVNFPYHPILSVACRPETDEVWVGGYHYIGKIENDTYQQITLPQGCTAERMVVDNSGRVWVIHYDSAAGEMGLAYYDESTWHFVPFSDLSFNSGVDIFRDLELAPDGRLFLVGILDVVYFDGVSWTNTHLPMNYGEFETIAFDGPDHFWVATTSVNCFDVPISEFGLVESDHGVIQGYKFKDFALPHSNITALAVDEYHNVWMGGSEGGIAVYNKEGVIVATKNTPALAPQMTAVAYPNPTSGDNITVEFDVLERSDVHLRVFNQLGQQVAGQTLQNADPNHFQWTLEKSTIGTGCFFWSITTNSGEKTGKIVFLD